MRPPRPRFTVRGLMVAAAAAGLLLGAGQMWRRSRAFGYLADFHGLKAGQLAEEWLDHATSAAINRDLAGLRGEEDRRRRLAIADEEGRIASETRRDLDHHLALAEEYRRASRLPWLAIGPGPE